MFALRRALRPLNVAAASLTTLQLTKCDEKKGAAVGIDLGTTYSKCVGSFRNGKVEIFANAEGMRTTPSYVALSTGHERLVGDAAKNQAARNARGTIYDAKRLIGRLASDSTVKADLKEVALRRRRRRGRQGHDPGDGSRRPNIYNIAPRGGLGGCVVKAQEGRRERVG